MGRVSVKTTDEVDSRLDQLALEHGSRTAVLLAALAVYRLDVVPIKKKKRAVAKPKDLGEGNHPKDVKEVVEFFRSRNVPEPVEQKAQLFFDHYQANGWKQGSGNALKNWGACLTTWQKNHPDWKAPEKRPVGKQVTVNQFLKWVKENRPAWLGRFRDIQDMGEVDDFYVEEYENNVRSGR